MSNHISKAIHEIINSLMKNDERLGEMLSYTVARLLFKIAKDKQKDWKESFKKIDHSAVVEWLEFSIKNDASWLYDTDDKGRPKKLLAFEGLNEIHREIRRDMKVATQCDGYIFSKNDKILDTNNLPNGLKIIGNLNLRDEKINHLPNNLSVSGDLNLIDAKIKTLPNDMSIGENVYLRGSDIINIQDNLSVGGDLNLFGTEVTRLPDGLKIGGSLYLRAAKITEIPNTLKVSGDLVLNNSSVTKLPDDLTIGRGLHLHGTKLKKLPRGLKIGGKLNVSGTEIAALPLDIIVLEEIDITDTAITSLPSSCHDEIIIVTNNGKISGKEFRDIELKRQEISEFNFPKL